jgi:TonB family protein
MASDLLQPALRALIVFSAALAVVLLARVPLRRGLGAGTAYLAWWLPPIALAASLLPAWPSASLPAEPVLGPMLVHATADAGAAVASAGLGDTLALAWIAGAFVLALLLGGLQRRYVASLHPLARDEQGRARSHFLAGPALVGAMRPLLVLPTDFEQRYAADERELVLAHEATHLKRGDARINAFAAALLCLYWFNPLAWIAWRCFRIDQELACDAAVLADRPAARKAYASALLKTQIAADAGWRLPAGCHWAVRHPLKERIAMLKRPTPAPLRRVVGGLLVACSALGASYVAWAGNTPAAEAKPRYLTRVVAADSMPPPKYPAQALANRITGNVMLEITVAPDGSVSDARVVHATPAGVFDEAAIAAARAWKFQPARDDHGSPLVGKIRVPVEFVPD